MKKAYSFIIIILICLTHNMCYGTFFDVESMRIGPNPLIKGTDPIVINYVASKAHTSEFYVYKISGETVFKKSYGYNIANISHAGECQFELISTAEMNQLTKELYIVMMFLTSGTETIKKRGYIIVK